MRSRLVMLAALAIAAAAVIFAVTRLASSSPSRPSAADTLLPPRPASYLGVYEAGSPPPYPMIATFAQAAGQEPNIAGYFSGWAEPFATSFAEQVRSHGAVALVQIDPSYASIPAI